jgi:hypothetical protein
MLAKTLDIASALIHTVGTYRRWSCDEQGYAEE